MQFFTTAWASGNLDDLQAEAVVERYNDHLAMFDRADEIYRFATTVSLNDAYLDRLVIDPITARVELLLLTGDLQAGYWRTTLSYGSAWVADGEGILKRGLSLRPSEIWYDEFTNSADGVFHDFLLAPRTDPKRRAGEFRIAFQDFSFSQVRAGERKLATAVDQSVWG